MAWSTSRSAGLDLYAQYATSFKPNFNLQPDGSELKPEIGEQWEVGNRIRLLDSRVYVNTSRLPHRARRTSRCRGPAASSIRPARSARRAPRSNWTAQWSSIYVRVGYGYTDAEYLDYVTTDRRWCRTVLSGKTRPRTPTNTFTYQARRDLAQRPDAGRGGPRSRPAVPRRCEHAVVRQLRAARSRRVVHASAGDLHAERQQPDQHRVLGVDPRLSGPSLAHPGEPTRADWRARSGCSSTGRRGSHLCAGLRHA